MACRTHMIRCVLLLAVLLQGATAATTYTVLDSLGWIIPPVSNIAYRTWAAGKDFDVGDSLSFNFTTGEHDVAKVTQTDYDNCAVTNAISNYTTGPATILLNSSGTHYFICTFNRHCESGQKLAISVDTSSGNSASSMAVGGFSVAILSIAIAFLY